MDLERALRTRIQSFVEELTVLIKQAALESVKSALTNGRSGATAQPAQKRKKKAARSGPMRKAGRRPTGPRARNGRGAKQEASQSSEVARRSGKRATRPSRQPKGATR